jgi:hypothetical protein
VVLLRNLNMGDFSSVTKELDLTKATTTPVTQADSSGMIAKSYGLRRAVSVEKLHEQLTYTAITIPSTYFAYKGIIVHQCNYQTDKPFIILKKGYGTYRAITLIYPRSCTTIKWVNADGTVSRYTLQAYLMGNISGINNQPTEIIPPFYNYQVVPLKFTIETWILGFDGFSGFNNFITNFPTWPLTNFVFNISLYTNPTKAGDVTPIQLPVTTTLDRTTLSVALPETLPTQYNTNCNWGLS